MDASDLAFIKAQTLEDFEDNLGGQLLEYHEVIQAGAADASPINNRFGFVDTPDGEPFTRVTELLFAHIYFDDAKGRRKWLQKAGDEFIGDYDSKVYIPTAELERKEVALKRDNCFIKLPDGEAYTVAAIYPLPRMYGDSIVNKLYLQRRKPIQDRPPPDP
jgi:hypothetical protein